MPQAEGITTGWDRLDNWSQDLADAINDRHDECVTRRFRSDNPVAMGVADAANEATSGETGDCPEPESGWSILDDWAGEIADRVNANHAECVSGQAQGNAKNPVLDSGWKRLDKWAAKIAGVIDANHNECVRLKPSLDLSGAETFQRNRVTEQEDLLFEGVVTLTALGGDYDLSLGTPACLITRIVLSVSIDAAILNINVDGVSIDFVIEGTEINVDTLPNPKLCNQVVSEGADIAAHLVGDDSLPEDLEFHAYGHFL